MLFDTHAHYCDKRFDEDREKLLASLPASGVGYVLTCPSTLDEARYSLSLAEKYPYIYAAVGVHPHECAEHELASSLLEIERLAAHERCVAIGECGLDYHYDFSPRDLQKEWFRAQCQLAKRLDKPIIVHDREAHADTLDILKETRPKGVLHCYSGSAESVRELCALGFYISFSGTVTFATAGKLADAVRAVPLDRILVETDCPYLAPVPNRGKRNSSLFLHCTLERVAELKGLSPDEMAKITTDNAKRLFGV